MSETTMNKPATTAAPATTTSTPVDLAALLARRNSALAATMVTGPASYAAGDEFRVADAAIVAELNRLMRPVRVGAVELRLTADRLNFAEVDPGTGEVLHVPSYDRKYFPHKFLFNYAAHEMRTRAKGGRR